MTNDVGVIGATYIANGKALAYLFTQINLPSHQLKGFGVKTWKDVNHSQARCLN